MVDFVCRVVVVVVERFMVMSFFMETEVVVEIHGRCLDFCVHCIPGYH